MEKKDAVNVHTKLLTVQGELKAPKGQYNNFGKYKYRNCEDILEAVKPLCQEVGATLVVTDEVIFIEGRHYIRATATFTDIATLEQVQGFAYAREAEIKTGMDVSQVTGAASSYARKYALNGLLCIDDTKDADSDETGGDKKAPTKTTTKATTATKPTATTTTKPVATTKTSLEVLQDRAIEYAKELGGQTNPKVLELCESMIGSKNPKKCTDEAKLTQLIQAFGKEIKEGKK